MSNRRLDEIWRMSQSQVGDDQNTYNSKAYRDGSLFLSQSKCSFFTRQTTGTNLFLQVLIM